MAGRFFMITSDRNKKLVLTIFWVGLLAGTLDILAAFTQYYLSYHKNPLRVLLYIASAVFGKKAYTEGHIMYWAGALFHYLIAYAFTLFFFLIYPRLAILSINRFLTGILYGIFTWSVMNLGVLPMARMSSPSFHWPKSLISVGIIIAAIGMPVSYLAYRYYFGIATVKKQTVVVI